MDKLEAYIGKLFADRYSIIKIIGRGENSVVFGAYDTAEGRTVALKVLRPEYNDDPVISERFATEAGLMAMVSHPNIVGIYDVSLEGQLRYFTMEYIEGITLKKHLLNRGVLPVDEILFLSRQILSALAAIHALGIVHSDIKPQNVVVLGDGHVYLMDFGISRLHKTRPVAPSRSEVEEIFNSYYLSEECNTSDLAVGTVQYVSPEQAQGHEIDHLSDIYSFGVMLYEMATGVLPFFAESAQQIASMHVRRQPTPPSVLVPELPRRLEAIILQALEKLPMARFSSADDMCRALEAFSKEYYAPKTSEEPQKRSFIETVRDTAVEYKNTFSVPSFVVGALCALLVTVVVGLAILSGALISERRDHDHVKIPYVTDRSIYEVLSEFDTEVYDFNIEYVQGDDRQGCIVRQSPAGGRIAAKRSGQKVTVHLTVVTQQLPPTMPELRYLTEAQATARLAAYDCQVEVVYRPHDIIEAGLVIATDPSGDEATQKHITLYVSTGPADD